MGMDTAKEALSVIGAETGRLEGELRISRERPGYTGQGYVTGFRQREGDRWSVRATISATGHYTLSIRCAADSRRICHLLVNGQDVGMCEVKGDGGFHLVSFPAVWMEKGEAELSLLESWGWFDLDQIRIEPGERLPDTYYRGKTSIPVNPYADEKTHRVLQYLVENYGKQTLAGQYANHGSSREIEALYAFTGKLPAIRGFDFIQDCPVYGGKGRDTDLAIAWSRRGGLVTFSWHWAPPLHGANFYTKYTGWDLLCAMTDGEAALLPLEEMERRNRRGLVSDEMVCMVRDIDAIAALLKRLQDQGVTVLWRPLHEAAGGWFWWGARGPDAYRWLWRFLFDRLTHYHRLRNLLWVWNGEHPDWYVGDDLCDILGEDVYTQPHNTDAQAKRFVDAAAVSSRKLVALTEAGVMPDPERMERDGVCWSWFNIWCREFLVDQEGKLTGTYTELPAIVKTYQSGRIVTMDRLPGFLRR